jgi:hypothetical protein
MSFRKIPRGVLASSLAYLVGLLIYRAVVHHSRPHWTDVPTFLELLAGFVLSTLATEWYFQRRAQKRSNPLEGTSR